MIGCDHAWREPQSFQFYKFNSFHIRFQQAVKYLIIAGQGCKDASAIQSACLDLLIIVLDATIVTAEFLVGSAVTDPVSALKAHRHLS
jgi:hypothetical protein